MGMRGDYMKRLSPLKAIRLHCIDCCCGQIKEVRKCTATTCNLWVFRMGHRPKVEIIEDDDSNLENSGFSGGSEAQEEDEDE
jgi:hypothetical protein